MLQFAGVIVAALGGTAIGIERQRSGHATGVNARFGGVRTFTLLGALGGIGGWLVLHELTAVAVPLLAGPVALIVAGYVTASRQDVDATTEAAALVVVAAGVLAGLDRIAFASATIAITALLLVEKSALHAAVGRIDDAELRAGARFAVMAVVVLPLLPEGPFGPLGGVRPRELWLLVLLFAGLSGIGYFARRLWGAEHGYLATGALAGLVSSTQATLSLARLSREAQPLGRPLALGAVAACTMLFPRVLVATSFLEPAVARELFRYLAAPALVGVATVLLALRGNRAEATKAAAIPDNPLNLVAALQMAVMFQAVLFAVHWSRGFGDPGVMISAAVLGLTDVDALTISMAKNVSAGLSPAFAARAIAVGVLANSVLKLGLAVVLGAPIFKRRAGLVLMAMAVALAIAIAVSR